MKKMLIVAGARPNFMKIAPIIRELEKTSGLNYKIIHTGQHYDKEMSSKFFDELEIPEPHYNLNVGSATHAHQTAAIMIGFEDICFKEMPDIVMVVGDVNSTVACGLVAKKLCIKLVHVEAGLRSNDRFMPEEINRIVTDSISDHLFVTEPKGIENLRREGHSDNRIHFVGHVMIDNLYYQINKLNDINTPVAMDLINAVGNSYAVCTLHRPSNVDNVAILELLIKTLADLSRTVPIIFPCHPRTLLRIQEFGLMKYCNQWIAGESAKGSLILTPPLGYMDFLCLWKNALCVVTDSGGLQEETTALKIPCITVRNTTERPITVEIGSNEVIGPNPDKLKYYFLKAISGSWNICSIPELWDGKASGRILKILNDIV